jgi:thiol:disulfide interchange protein DsbD
MNDLKKAVSRHLAIVLAVASLLASLPARAEVQGPAPSGVQWETLDQSLRIAKAKKKGVFLMIYADWCGYCHQMEATTFRSPQIIAKLNSAFVAAKLNGESPRVMNLETGSISEGQWAMRHGVQGFPTLFALDAKGRVITGYPGYMTTSQTSEFLADVADFLQRGGIDKLGSFTEWQQKPR